MWQITLNFHSINFFSIKVKRAVVNRCYVFFVNLTSVIFMIYYKVILCIKYCIYRFYESYNIASL